MTQYKQQKSLHTEKIKCNARQAVTGDSLHQVPEPVLLPELPATSDFGPADQIRRKKVNFYLAEDCDEYVRRMAYWERKHMSKVNASLESIIRKAMKEQPYEPIPEH